MRREKITEIEEEEEENINNELLKKYFTNDRSPSDMQRKLHETEVARNEDRVYLIKLVLDKMKKVTENVPEIKTFKIEEN